MNSAALAASAAAITSLREQFPYDAYAMLSAIDPDQQQTCITFQCVSRLHLMQRCENCRFLQEAVPATKKQPWQSRLKGATSPCTCSRC